MIQFIIYDMKVAALLTVFYMLYRLLMERETFHRLNRAVLLASVALSLVLPLCIFTLHHTVWLPPTEAAATAPSAPEATAISPAADSPLWQLLLGVVVTGGIAVRLIVFARNYRMLRRLIATCEQHPQSDGITVAVSPLPVASFSWMRTIVMSQQDYTSGTAPLVLAHEREHIRLHHSCDVLFVELFTALQWFNPVVWLLRQDLRMLHEYEADAAVLSSGFNESQYISLLMQKATGVQACALACGIGNSRTKKRIIMMLKKKSSRAAAAKILFLLPIAAVSLALTARTTVDYKMLPEPARQTDSLSNQLPELTVVHITSPGTSYQPQQDPVFDVCEVLPQYPGGTEELMKFLMLNVKYPKECADSAIQGRVVVSFIVEKDGQVSNLSVARSVHPRLDAEALRVLSLMPRWLPGRQNGKAVRVRYNVPCSFRLQ